MEDNQPSMARDLLNRMNITKGLEYEFHTQDPMNGADFDTLMKSINGRMGLPSRYLDNTDRPSLSKEILGFNLFPEK